MPDTIIHAVSVSIPIPDLQSNADTQPHAHAGRYCLAECIAYPNTLADIDTLKHGHRNGNSDQYHDSNALGHANGDS